MRAAILGWEPDEVTANSLAGAYDRTFLLGDPPDYEPVRGPLARRHGRGVGRHPLEVAYDAMLADDGHGLLYVPILNYAEGSLEPVREMFLHPRAAVGPRRRRRPLRRDLRRLDADVHAHPLDP